MYSLGCYIDHTVFAGKQLGDTQINQFEHFFFISIFTVGDDLIKDCLSVLYNCCICVGISMIMSVGYEGNLENSFHVWSALGMLKWFLLFFRQTEGVTKSLAARDDFVMFLFTLMSNKKTFLQTATLIEDIMGVRKVNNKNFTLNNYLKYIYLI